MLPNNICLGTTTTLTGFSVLCEALATGDEAMAKGKSITIIPGHYIFNMDYIYIYI